MKPAPVRALRRVAGLAATASWGRHSRLFLVGDDVPWSVNHDMRNIERIARTAGIKVAPERLLPYARKQSVFYGDQFRLLRQDWPPDGHRVGFAYFHGRPGTPGEPTFDDIYMRLRDDHHRVHRVQVSHAAFRDLVLETGIAPSKVFMIRIGIDLPLFPLRTEALRDDARAELGVPAGAFLLGSLQKDGVGWGEGFEPKLIKGPDVLLRTVELLKPRLPGLHVVLTGPARGYVRAGLDRLGVPFVHRQVSSYAELPAIVRALDVCLIASREEGGPKALLESMASGVPVVTTRVGQAADLVRHGENAWLAETEDAEALAELVLTVAGGGEAIERAITAARSTAEEHAYARQLGQWRAFFDGFVRSGDEGAD